MWFLDEKVGIHTSLAPSAMPWSTACLLKPPEALLSGTPENSATFRWPWDLLSKAVIGVAE